MSALSTHVLDLSLGLPAGGIEVALSTRDGQPLSTAATDADGRVAALGPERLPAGDYALRFDTGSYFGAGGRAAFYPEVVVTFTIADDDEAGTEHYHVPVLLSPFGYSTYRGS